MKTKIIKLLAVFGVIASGAFYGCDDDDGWDIMANYSGKYVAFSGKLFLDPAISGAGITSLTIEQADDGTIIVTDNNGNVYIGKLHGKSDNSVEFTLKGVRDGVEVTIKGTLNIKDNTIIIDGIYKEKGGVKSTVSGHLETPVVKTPPKAAPVSPKVYPPVLINDGIIAIGATYEGDSSATYEATGGSGSYKWSYTHPAMLSGTTGKKVTITVPPPYPFTPQDLNTVLTVRDANDPSKTDKITIVLGEPPAPPVIW